ncbi:MAG TPA: transcriptional regulator TrmB [Micromonosporaceae bacterium]|nr:transcriptional regulator TrmB [Micromonosporaceae bacterium]
MSLSELGVSPDDERIYRLLLNQPNVTLAELVSVTGWQPPRMRRHVRSLEVLGLLTRTPTRPTRFTPAAPESAIEVLALQRQEAIERARAGASKLAEQFRSAMSHDHTPVTVVRGRPAIAQRFFQAQKATRHEVLILDRPPYVVEPVQQQHTVQLDLLSRGVSYRTIYDEAALDTPEKLAQARHLAARGEQSRVLSGVPMKMVITDRSLALVPFILSTERETLVLQPSALLDGLVTFFEMMWSKAIPLWTPGADTPSIGQPEEQLLALLAAGLTDEAIARRLGVAQRTVERRMRRVMDKLGAETRFQAGLNASRLGLLGD